MSKASSDGTTGSAPLMLPLRAPQGHNSSGLAVRKGIREREKRAEMRATEEWRRGQGREGKRGEGREGKRP